MHDSLMSAAAVKRMRTRYAPQAAPRPMAHEASVQDRRRIPLEGRRKTAEWRAHQAFKRAADEILKRRPLFARDETLFEPTWLPRVQHAYPIRDETMTGGTATYDNRPYDSRPAFTISIMGTSCMATIQIYP